MIRRKVKIIYAPTSYELETEINKFLDKILNGLFVDIKYTETNEGFTAYILYEDLDE